MLMGLMSRLATLSNFAEGSGPSSTPGAGAIHQGDPVKTPLDHTKPKSPRHFRPSTATAIPFFIFSNFKFLTPIVATQAPGWGGGWGGWGWNRPWGW